jgi:hypothetical protein
MSNRIQEMYGNRKSYVTTDRKLVVVDRSGVSMIGRTNVFENKMGINNPTVNSVVGVMQQYGYPMLNYTDSELQRIGN